jgi:hypothetical protein
MKFDRVIVQNRAFRSNSSVTKLFVRRREHPCACITPNTQKIDEKHLCPWERWPRRNRPDEGRILAYVPNGTGGRSHGADDVGGFGRSNCDFLVIVTGQRVRFPESVSVNIIERTARLAQEASKNVASRIEK